MKLREKMKRFWTLDVHNHEGFTLVELIIVIAILAILSTGAIAGYSAYIEKAKASADLNLLSAYNTALTSACAVNGVPMSAMRGTEIVLEGEDGAKTYAGITVKISNTRLSRSGGTDEALAVAIANAFETYLGEENKTIAFKYYVQVICENGSLVGHAAGEEVTILTTTAGVTVTITQADAEKFNDSIYSTGMESEALLGQVDMVTQFAAGMMTDGEGNSLIAQLFGSENYINALANTLGVDPSDPDFEEKFGAASMQMIRNAAKAKDPSLTDEYLMSDAFADSALRYEVEAQIAANNAVLYAAQNSAAASKDILDILKQDNSKASIAQNLLNAENNDVGLAQAAMAYGLYTAYAERNGIDISNVTPDNVLSQMDNDANFKAYIKGEKIGETSTAGQAEADLEGFLAAMNMISSNADNNELVENVLINGFDTTNLQELLDGAKGE